MRLGLEINLNLKKTPGFQEGRFLKEKTKSAIFENTHWKQLIRTNIFVQTSQLACELWGVYELPEVEKVHTTCLQRFLHFSTHSSNLNRYAETGRYPLF